MCTVHRSPAECAFCNPFKMIKIKLWVPIWKACDIALLMAANGC